MVHNELLKGNLERVLENLSLMCDVISVCDDGSFDDSHSLLRNHPKIPSDLYLRHEVADVTKLIQRKKRQLECLHRYAPKWILWLDGDEILDTQAVAGLRTYLATLPPEVEAVDMQEVNLWLSDQWARTDNDLGEGEGWGSGWFRRCWRWSPELEFGEQEGMHLSNHPATLTNAVSVRAPFKVLHYGYASRSQQRYKLLHYGVTWPSAVRRILYGPPGTRYGPENGEKAEFTRIPPDEIPCAVVSDGTPPPSSFGEEFLKAVNGLGLRETGHGLANGSSDLFMVTIPTYNRAYCLPKAIDSVLAQTYKKWVLLIVDDGSDDDTRAVVAKYMDQDPRIFYLRYPENRGGRAANEVSCEIASRWGAYWTRLSSDDWFGPHKLANDMEAFHKGAKAVYGHYRTCQDGNYHPELGNQRLEPSITRKKLMGAQFLVSWANFAVATQALRKVKERYGTYVDPSLKHMEDFLLNYRLSAVGYDWVWRPGESDDGVWLWNTRDGGSHNKDGVIDADQRRTEALIASGGGPALSRIPKRLAFFWGGGPLPPLRALSIESALRLNPDWDIVLYRDTTPYYAGVLTGEHRADAYDGPDHLGELERGGLKVVHWTPPVPAPSPVQASDLFRWQWLSEGGGVFADTDIFFLRSLNGLPSLPTAEAGPRATAFVPRDPDGALTIGLVAATADDEYFRSVAAEAKRRIEGDDEELLRDRQAIGVSVLNTLGSRTQLGTWPPVIYLSTGMEVEMLANVDAVTQALNASAAKGTPPLIGVHWFGGSDTSRGAIHSGVVPEGLQRVVGG
jgi:hypothetical protein